MELVINPRFRDLLPPLTEEEYSNLESSIIKEGCRHDIVVWGNTIVDGHNRYSICNRHDIGYSVEFKTFESDEDAENWIIDNQNSRRNLTDAQKSNLRGIRYRNEKKAVGENQFDEKGVGNSYPPSRTSEKIASQFGVSEKTIRNDEKFADGLEEIGKLAPIFKDEILSESVKLPKSQIASFPSLSKEHQKQFIENKGGFKVCKVCGLSKSDGEFHSKKSECKVCDKERKLKDRESKSQFQVTDEDLAILESMTKKEPSEEGKGKCLDNTIITDFHRVIMAFRNDINKYLFMPSFLSELSTGDQAIKDLMKAKNDIEVIMSKVKEQA